MKYRVKWLTPPRAGFGDCDEVKGSNGMSLRAFEECEAIPATDMQALEDCFVAYTPRNNRQINAFTLAETLITLVVIGIIAAITIPSISRASEKYILRNQFKKTYSTILNAMHKAETDLGGNINCSYEAGTMQPGGRTSDCSAFYEQMFANLNIMKYCNGNAKANGCIPDPYLKQYITGEGQPGFHRDKIENTNRVYNFADGTIFICYNQCYMPLFLVDTNGSKGPNESGKDVFEFYILENDPDGLRIRNEIVLANVSNKPYFRTINGIYGE